MNGSDDFSNYRLPAKFGSYGGVYVANVPHDQCQFLIDTMKPGPKVVAALRWRMKMKNDELHPQLRSR